MIIYIRWLIEEIYIHIWIYMYLLELGICLFSFSKYMYQHSLICLISLLLPDYFWKVVIPFDFCVLFYILCAFPLLLLCMWFIRSKESKKTYTLKRLRARSPCCNDRLVNVFIWNSSWQCSYQRPPWGHTQTEPAASCCLCLLWNQGEKCD